MKIRIKPIVALLALSTVISLPVHAAVTSQEVQDLSAQASELKKTLASLQNQVSSLEQEVKQSKRAANKQNKQKNSNARTSGTTLTGKQLRQLIAEEKEFLPFDLDVPGQAFVSTGPYVGVRFQFAGNDLIVNSPSVDTDLQLLAIRKSILMQLRAMGGELVKEPYHSHLLFSGLVEGAAGYFAQGGARATTDINLSSVNLDAFFIGPSNWLLGFIEFSYVDDMPINDVFNSTSRYRVADSRLYVNKAFVTVGNLAESPFYGSFGQYYVPFGTYSSVMISSPFTKVLTRTKARAITLGFQQQNPDNALMGSMYIFRGDTYTGSVSRVNNGGLNIGYKFKVSEVVKGKVGAGVIGNIADSGGMQLGAGFQYNEKLVHRVPGYNLRGGLSITDHFDIFGEYVGASTSFHPNDMSFNGNGAKPWATDLEAAVSMEVFNGHPSSLGVGYAQSHDALALGLPLNRISLALNTSWWRNTLQSFEMSGARQYAASNTSSGGGSASSATESGQFNKAVIAQFDYFF
jgi:outer membrane murein-binding lipoprotein Lpp